MQFGKQHTYQDDMVGAAGGGAPAAVVTQVAPAATVTPPADAVVPAVSALAGGAGDWSPQSVPDKYRVMGADGEVDMQATLRKVDEGRTALEKRMGEGGSRPKTADEYKLPDSDAIKGLGLDDASAKAFKDKAHGWGLSQAQYEAVMGEYASLAPALVQGAQAETTDTAVAALKDAWKGDYDNNIRDSFKVVNSVAEAAGIPMADVEKAIGNNPVAIRLFAALAPQMREDSTPAAANGATGGGMQSRSQYVAENWAAYSNPQDPKHATVTARAKALADRESKGMPPL